MLNLVLSKFGSVKAVNGKWFHIETFTVLDWPIKSEGVYVTWLETAEWLHGRPQETTFRKFVDGKLEMHR